MIRYVSKNNPPSDSSNSILSSPPKTDSSQKVFVESKAQIQRTFNVYYSARPAYYFSRFFGLMPFSIKNHLNEMDSAYVTIFDLVWFIFAIFFYGTLLYAVTVTFVVPSELQAVIFFTGSRMILMTDLFLTMISIVMDMCNRSRLIKMLQEFHLFDKEVNYEAKTWIFH